MCLYQMVPTVNTHLLSYFSTALSLLLSLLELAGLLSEIGPTWLMLRGRD